jgi:hypothetical protein
MHALGKDCAQRSGERIFLQMVEAWLQAADIAERRERRGGAGSNPAESRGRMGDAFRPLHAREGRFILKYFLVGGSRNPLRPRSRS